MAQRGSAQPVVVGDVDQLELISGLDVAERLRVGGRNDVDRARQSEFGQFLTPASVAELMASMFSARSENLTLLDPGAGVGALSAATVSELLRRRNKPSEIAVTAFEIDIDLAERLDRTLDACQRQCELANVNFRYTIRVGDFLEIAARELDDESTTTGFDLAIINPPYKKINVGSSERESLRRLGLETSNLYTAFVAAALTMLRPGGELVAITPRSFCNGRYFKPFRQFMLERAQFKRVHVFESRDHAFRDDAVLQENVIMHVQRPTSKRAPRVALTTNASPGSPIKSRSVLPSQVVRPGDPEYFVHLVFDEVGDAVSAAMAALPCRLADLGLSVSTGRVVDFRSKSALRADPDSDTAPLIYPLHLRNGSVDWPVPGARKPNAIVIDDETTKLLVPDGDYVLIRRFSAKEERRRVVATYLAQGALRSHLIGFENHLNYFHVDGAGIPDRHLACGLAVYLNSRFVDEYVRQFNGHTQVNAGDLRNLRYPDADQLRNLGTEFGEDVGPSDAVDGAVNSTCGSSAVEP